MKLNLLILIVLVLLNTACINKQEPVFKDQFRAASSVNVGDSKVILINKMGESPAKILKFTKNDLPHEEFVYLYSRYNIYSGPQFLNKLPI